MTDRLALVQALTFSNPSDRSDLLDPNMTHEDLVAMLATIVAQHHHVQITSVRTDHGSDLDLGPHGHSSGYAVDLWLPIANAYPLLTDLELRNPLCTKIGLGGVFKTLSAELTVNGTLVFYDNSQDHIHIQTA